MFPPTMAYAITRLQQSEDVANAQARRRSRRSGRGRRRGPRRGSPDGL